MKKIFFLLFIVSLLAINAKAQVTIGSQDAPTPGAVLELKSSNLGFLPPRVTLTRPSLAAPLVAHVKGMVVYNLAITDSLREGLYYDTGSRWVCLSADPYSTKTWFYMPSIVFDTSTLGDFSVDLYQEFRDQFNSDAGLVKGSIGAPAKVLETIPTATDLYYYVTDYDPNVFEITEINNRGVMKYKIKNQASDATFINIVFVEKPAK